MARLALWLCDYMYEISNQGWPQKPMIEDTKSDFPHHHSSLAQQRLILPHVLCH